MEGFILKVVGGPQNGAEIALAEGEYLLGSGAEDDIQFNDLSLKAGHARLKVAERKVEIRAEAGGLASGNGLSLEAGDGNWREVEQLDLITIGTTRFAIGAVTANWTSLLDTLRDGTVSEPVARQPEPLPSWRSRLADVKFSLRLALMGGGVVLLMVVAAVLLVDFEGKRRLLPADPAADLAAVSEAIAALEFPNTLSVRQEVDGAIFLTGYVNSLVERRAVVNAIEATGVQIGLRVWVRDVIRNSFEALAKSLGLNVQYELSDEGALAVRGVVLDAALAGRLVELAEEQIIGLSDVRSEMRTAETLFAEVNALAQRSGIADTVVLRLDGSIIEASGVVGLDKVDIWAGFIETYVRQFAELISLRSYVQLVSEPEQVIVYRDRPGEADGADPAAATEDGMADGMADGTADGTAAAADRAGAGEPGDARDRTVAGIDDPAVPGEAGADTAALADTPGTDPDSPARPEGTGGEAAAPVGARSDVSRQPAEQRPGDGTDTGDARRDQAADRASEIAGGDDHGGIRPPLVVGQPSTNVPGSEVAPVVIGRSDGAPGGTVLDLERLREGSYRPRDLFAGVVDDGAPRAATGRGEFTPAEVVAPGDLPPEAGGPDGLGLPGRGQPRRAASVAGKGMPQRAWDGTATATPELFLPTDPDAPPGIGDEDLLRALASYEARGAPACEQRPKSLLLAEASVSLRAWISGVGRGEEEIDLGQLTRDLVSAWAKDGLARIARSHPRVRDMARAIDLLAELRGPTARDEKIFAELAICPAPVQECWSGSLVDTRNMATVLFWLDLLAVTDAAALPEFRLYNQALILEAALNPRRLTACASGTSAAEARVAQSFYISESLLNPGIIHVVAGRMVRYPIIVTGAHLVNPRFLQTADGLKFREGSAPTPESRLLHIGELGSYYRTGEGIAISIYDPRMSWRHDG